MPRFLPLTFLELQVSATPDTVSRNFTSESPFEITLLSEQILVDTGYCDSSFISAQCGEADGVEGNGGGVIYDGPTNSLVIALSTLH